MNGPLLRTAAKWTAGVVISTPIIACVQGAYLLADYRSKHSDAPRPDVPSRGIVVVRSSGEEDARCWTDGTTTTTTTTTAQNKLPTTTNMDLPDDQQQQQPPLRILVVGDSLAAGVGIRESSTPILPAALAQALSHAMNGRAVHWTCVGRPGVSSSLLVQDIYQMDNQQVDDSSDDEQPHSTRATFLSQKWAEFQRESRRRAQERLAAARQSAREWWEHRGDDDVTDDDDDYRNTSHNRDSGSKRRNENGATGKNDNDNNNNNNNKSPNRIQRWWQRRRKRVQRDWDGLVRVMRSLDPRNVESAGRRRPLHPLQGDDDNNDHQSTISSPPPCAPLQRHASVDPTVVGPYDIAIVLTGLNDLKDAFLPFMMPAQRKQRLKEAAQDDSDGGGDNGEGFKSALVRILHALEDKMHIRVPGLPNNSDTSHENDEKQPTLPESEMTRTTRWRRQRRSGQTQHQPLVVFPALPVAPIEMSHVVPLGWFIGPLFRHMDHHKKILADMYPGLVLFVDAPSTHILSEVEASRGPLWENLQKEQVLLQLTDVVHSVRERVELRMKQHYRSWFLDAGEEGGEDMDDEDFLLAQTQYEIELDGVRPAVDPMTASRRRRHPGATMVSCDGVHPSDRGYEFWGRYIAAAIIKNMNIEEERR